MTAIVTTGIDFAKNVFAVHGVDAIGKSALVEPTVPRTSRINALRGFCREFGITIPQGARTWVETIARVLADPRSAVPELIRHTAGMLLEEIRLLEARIAQVEASWPRSPATARPARCCSWCPALGGITPKQRLAMAA